MEHGQENLFDLANKLNALTLQGTEQEEENVHRDKNCPPELVVLTHRKKKMKQFNQRYHVLVKLNFRKSRRNK